MKFDKLLSWNNLRENLSSMTNPLDVCREILSWLNMMKKSCNKQELTSYAEYIGYYEALDLNNYEFEDRWYSLDRLITSNLINRSFLTLEDVLIRCRDVLHEILVFRSNRDCKLLGMDQLRVYEYKGSVLFCCDSCAYCEDLYGKEVRLEQVILPATQKLVRKFKIAPDSLS